MTTVLFMQHIIEQLHYFKHTLNKPYNVRLHSVTEGMLVFDQACANDLVWNCLHYSGLTLIP